MRVLVLPLAVPLPGEPDPVAGALSRAVAREIAARVGRAEGVQATFRPFLHEVEGRRRFGVYSRRWPDEDLKRLVADSPEADLLVHGELDPGDPFRITLEVRRMPGLVRICEEAFSAPRFDGFTVVERAAGFVLRCAELPNGDLAAGGFPARKFEAWLHLLRGRDAAARLEVTGTPEEPASLFEGFLAAIDEEPGLAAAKEEMAALATGAVVSGQVLASDAEAALLRLVEIDRRCLPAWSALGRVRERGGDEPGAEEALRAAVDLEPGRPALRFELGAMLLRHGRTGRAAKILETVRSDPVVGAEALLDLGTIRASKGDTEGAIEMWREAVSRRPDLGLAWANLAKILVAEGRFDEAEEAFDRGFQCPDPPAALRLVAGIHLAEQNRYREGIGHLEEALRLVGTDPWAHVHLGRCYEAEGDKARALHHLRRALFAGGEAAAKAESILGEFTDADREKKLHEMLADAIRRPAPEQVVLLKALLREEAKFTAALVRLGIALIAVKKPRAAEKHFRRALKMVPEDAEAWSGLATALKTRRKWKAAEEAHHRAIALAPHHPPYRLNLADTLARHSGT